MKLEEWLDAFYEAWQPKSGDEATAGRKAYGEIRDAILERGRDEAKKVHDSV